MPHYFAEGYRDGKPMPALYVQAENPVAAAERAIQLKMQEVTGVRLAKSPPPPLLKVGLFPIGITLTALIRGCVRQTEGASLAPALFLTLLISIPLVLVIYLVLIKPHRKKYHDAGRDRCVARTVTFPSGR